VPFGPEISWPQGFRQLDQRSPAVTESAYDTGSSVYQQPAMDDYGYGDPGYADPSYDGPKAPPADPGFRGGTGSRTPSGPPTSGWSGYLSPGTAVPGYQVPDSRDSSRSGYAGPGYAATGSAGPGSAGPGSAAPGYAGPGYAGPGSQPQDFTAASTGQPDIYPVTGAQEVLPDYPAPSTQQALPDYPVTGAQEALPDTGPQPVARRRDAQDSGGPAATGSSAYPEQWYGNPRLDDQRPPDARPTDARPTDPRLAGMRYDELRYDEPSDDDPSGDAPSAHRGFDGSFDDESWYEELRRGGPAYLQTPGDQPFPAGPASRAEAGIPGPGPQPGYPQVPPADWFTGQGPGRGDRGDRGGSAAALSAGRATSAGPRPGGPPEPASGLRMATPAGAREGRQPASGREPDSAFSPALTSQESGFLSAPTAQESGFLSAPTGKQSGFLSAPTAPVGVLTPPAPVRPGHGLDGPEITSSWPAAPQVDQLESFAEFWREDDQDGDYAGLFGDRVVAPDGAKPATKRRIGRRRGGSNDHRLWLALGGVVVLAAGAIIGIIKFEFPSHGGPAHTMVTPSTIGTYVRTVDLERQTNVAQLRAEVIKMSSGHASSVVSAVYESGNSAAGNDEQIIMFIGGHLANAAPAASVASFTQKFPGAEVVSAGSLGGKAACVQEGSSSDGVSMCAWFDNDSFGEIVSPTMNSAALAQEMLMVRPAVEQVVKK
jgi:hypothetical protein